MNPVVRVVLVLVGAAAVVVGGVWLGQGAGLIPGSTMTGDRTWLVIGLVAIVVGVLLIVLAVRRRRRRLQR